MKITSESIKERYEKMSDVDLAHMRPEALTEDARSIFYAELKRRGHSGQSFAVLQNDAAEEELAAKRDSRSKHIYNIKWLIYTLLACIVIGIAAVAAKNLWGGLAGTLTSGILSIVFICVALRPRIKNRKL